MILARLLAGLAMVGLIAVPAMAASRHHHGGIYYGGGGFYSSQPPSPYDAYGKQNGRYCPRMCAEDRNPCDPISFKIADGRCDPYD